MKFGTALGKNELLEIMSVKNVLNNFHCSIDGNERYTYKQGYED